MLDYKIKEYSQWFPGKENEVVDSLSRDDHICDQLLTLLLFPQTPEQMPHNFTIFPLPPVIASQFLAIPHHFPAVTQQREEHQRRKIAHGFDFKNSYKKSMSSMTLSLIHSMTNKKSPSFLPLHKPFAKSSFLKLTSLPWSSFRNNFRRDPRPDEDGNPSRILSKQYKGYKNKDSKES